MTPSEINDRLFIAFPLGWMAGIAAGSFYATFHWLNLQAELGRTLLVAVTVSQAVTLGLTMLIVRKISKELPTR